MRVPRERAIGLGNTLQVVAAISCRSITTKHSAMPICATHLHSNGSSITRQPVSGQRRSGVSGR
jgi:hypothetical protein